MPVVPAGVHLAGVGGPIGRPLRLLDVQGVHIGAQPDGSPLAILQGGDHPRLADALLHLQSEFRKLLGGEFRRLSLLE